MSRIDLTDEDLRCLSRLLSAAIEEEVEIDCVEEVSEGANTSRHKKAVLKNGRTFGLKAAERCTKGTAREYLTALSAKTLQLPGSGACGVFLMPDGAPLARMQVAALEWLPGGKPVKGSGSATNDRKSVDTARQLGQWLWLCFYFEVSDRKPANWVWSEDEKTIAMIDFEDWRPGNVNPEQLFGPVREILGGQITLDHAKAILNGLQMTKDAWTTAREQLVSPFSHHGENLDSDFVNEDLVDVTAKVSSIGRPDLIS